MAKGRAANHQLNLNGRQLITSRPGTYAKKQTTATSKNDPKLTTQFLMPCWKMDEILAHDQVGGLHDNNTGKETGLTGELQMLAVIVGPFLVVRVNQVVDGLLVPRDSQAIQSVWQETTFGHDHKVDKVA